MTPEAFFVQRAVLLERRCDHAEHHEVLIHLDSPKVSCGNGGRLAAESGVVNRAPDRPLQTRVEAPISTKTVRLNERMLATIFFVRSLLFVESALYAGCSGLVTPSRS